MVKKKNMVNIDKDKTLLTVGVLIVVGFLLFGFNDVLTGNTAIGQVYEREIHTHLWEGEFTYYKGIVRVDLVSVAKDDNSVVVSVDYGETQTVQYGGCGAKDPGKWVIGGTSKGLVVRVCAVGDRDADLDFRL